MTDRPTDATITGYCGTCGRGDIAPTLDEYEQQRQRAELAEKRLRLAHQAREAKEGQLDDIRRALCDTGLMRDDDPYSHADLADVIRQTAAAPAAPEEPRPDLDERVRAAVHEALHALPGGQFTSVSNVVGVVAGAALAEVHRVTSAPAATEATHTKEQQ